MRWKGEIAKIYLSLIECRIILGLKNEGAKVETPRKYTNNKPSQKGITKRKKRNLPFNKEDVD